MGQLTERKFDGNGTLLSPVIGTYWHQGALTFKVCKNGCLEGVRFVVYCDVPETSMESIGLSTLENWYERFTPGQAHNGVVNDTYGAAVGSLSRRQMARICRAVLLHQVENRGIFNGDGTALKAGPFKDLHYSYLDALDTPPF